jgi:oxalate decarboxylase
MTARAKELPFQVARVFQSRRFRSQVIGGTNKELDLQNPDNLGQQSTDNGVVVNLKWSFSDSKTRLLNGGWAREQVITDLPASHDIASAQQHLTKGSIRELHWHRVVS